MIYMEILRKRKEIKFLINMQIIRLLTTETRLLIELKHNKIL
jgi:hypothetical protein